MSFVVYLEPPTIKASINLQNWIAAFIFFHQELACQTAKGKCFSTSIPDSAAYLDQFLPKLTLSSHSISTNEVAQAKIKRNRPEIK